jgi:hypothetical protein
VETGRAVIGALSARGSETLRRRTSPAVTTGSFILGDGVSGSRFIPWLENLSNLTF